MCGRFVVSYTYDELVNYLNNTFSIFDLDIDIDLPRYNVAPGQQVISVVSDGEKYRAGTLKWGFIPSWSTDEKMGYKMINARSETIADKASFRHSFYNKRCVILANGFYEWKRHEKEKTPMLIQTEEGRMFVFAGLWSGFKRDDGTMLYTTTIITTKANEIMADIHDRMPVIMDIKQAKEWLNPDQKDKKELRSLLTQYPSKKMSFYEVSSLVNSVKNDVPECIAKV